MQPSSCLPVISALGLTNSSTEGVLCSHRSIQPAWTSIAAYNQHGRLHICLPLQTALELTDSQVADMLHLRQLLYCKQGQLARQRKALLQQMASVRSGVIELVGEKFLQLALCSEQLRNNGAEEYCIWVEFGGAYHAGVSPLMHFCIHACTQADIHIGTCHHQSRSCDRMHLHHVHTHASSNS